MTEDPEWGVNEDSSQDRTHPKKRGIRTDGNKHLPALLGMMLILIFAVGIFYFITNRPAARDTKGDETLASRTAALEQKVTSLEAQIAEFQGKSSKGATDPFLLHQVEALAKKVEALETGARQPGVETKTIPAPPKPAGTSQKRYHTVQKGETLLKIGKKYGLTAEELRKLNNLSKDQSIKIGQKLLVSPER